MAGKTVLLEPSLQFKNTYNVVPLPVLITVANDDTVCRIPVCNWNPYPVHLPENTCMGIATIATEVPQKERPLPNLKLLSWNTPEANAKHWEEVKSKLEWGENSNEQEEAHQKLLKLLEQYHDCFACNMEELGEAVDTEFHFDITEKPPKQAP